MPKSPTQQATSKGDVSRKFIKVLISLVALLCAFATATAQKPPNEKATSPKFTIVKEWPLGKIIVISPALRRDEAKLVELIRNIASDPNVVNLRIYDDLKAANDTRDVFDLPTAQQDAILKHFVGLFTRIRGKGSFLYYPCYRVLPNGDVDIDCSKRIGIE